MQTETGRFIELPEDHESKPEEKIIPFEKGEVVELKGHMFRIREINLETHEMTLRSTKFQKLPTVGQLKAGISKAQQELADLQTDPA